MPRLGLLLAFCVAFLCSPLYAQTSCSGMSLGRGASLNGFIPFPADNAWNQDISNASVDPNSDALINFIGASTPMHPDFGAGLYAGSTIGIPYVVVSGSPFVNIHFTAYGSESDPGPMPVPHNAPIEGYPHPGQRRPPRAGARSRQLLAVRALPFLREQGRKLERRFSRGLGSAQ
jgi:hypothetical protein